MKAFKQVKISNKQTIVIISSLESNWLRTDRELLLIKIYSIELLAIYSLKARETTNHCDISAVCQETACSSAQFSKKSSGYYFCHFLAEYKTFQNDKIRLLIVRQQFSKRESL